MGCNSEKLIELIKNNTMILTEGAVVERLRRTFNIKCDDFIVYAGAIYDKTTREILKGIYKEYIEIAIKYSLPIMIMSSTRRANKDRIKESKYKNNNVNFDYIEFLEEIRSQYNEYKENIFVGALIGTKGDSYNANEALKEDEAYEFHKYQCMIFKESKADFIFAGVLPSVSEAKGLSKAMAETNLPYIVSFVVNKKGELLDNTIINDAIKEIDKYYKPMAYMVNCVHPKNVLIGLNMEVNKTAIVRNRLKGIQANTSSLSPEELNNNCILQEDNFGELIIGINELKVKFGFNILGGCCGTNAKHIEEIANGINSSPNVNNLS